MDKDRGMLKSQGLGIDLNGGKATTTYKEESYFGWPAAAPYVWAVAGRTLGLGLTIRA